MFKTVVILLVIFNVLGIIVEPVDITKKQFLNQSDLEKADFLLFFDNNSF